MRHAHFVNTRTEVRRYGPGEAVAQSTPGDFLLTHAKGLTSSLIRFGQQLRYRGSQSGYAHWSHAAVFVSRDGEIVEAIESGVQQRNVSVYQNTEYHVIHLLDATDEDRAHAVAFAEHCLNDYYGYWTDFSLVFNLLTGTKFFFGVDGQLICSGLAARALERTGAIFGYDSWHMLPADLAEAYGVTPEAGASIGTIPDATTCVVRRSGKKPVAGPQK
jgi:uncharacterized protein YycO